MRAKSFKFCRKNPFSTSVLHMASNLTFETVRQQLPWREINNCPGRFVLRKAHAPTKQTTSQFVQQLAGTDAEVAVQRLTHTVGNRRDAIEIFLFSNGGGILTYIKEDESNNDVDSNSVPKHIHVRLLFGIAFSFFSTNLLSSRLSTRPAACCASFLA